MPTWVSVSLIRDLRRTQRASQCITDDVHSVIEAVNNRFPQHYSPAALNRLSIETFDELYRRSFIHRSRSIDDAIACNFSGIVLSIVLHCNGF